LPGSPAANAAFGVASAVPFELGADQLNEISQLRTNDHRSTAAGDPWFEDLRKVFLKIFKIKRTTDKMLNDSIRLLEKPEVGKTRRRRWE
jgi:hypothetical protein